MTFPVFVGRDSFDWAGRFAEWVELDQKEEAIRRLVKKLRKENRPVPQSLADFVDGEDS